MDLKARLNSLENQINALQARITTHQPAFNSDNSDGLGNLKQILMRLKEEHQSVLDSINQALRLVEASPVSSSSPTHSASIAIPQGSSPLTSRLRDRISAACSTPPRPSFRSSLPAMGSSPLTPSVEKSHITFEILRDLENQSTSRQNSENQGTSRLNQATPSKTKHVHFNTNPDLDLSQASQEYLKKYNLLP